MAGGGGGRYGWPCKCTSGSRGGVLRDLNALGLDASAKFFPEWL